MSRTQQNAESWPLSTVGNAIQRSGDDKAIASYDTLKTAFLSGELGTTTGDI